MYRNILVAIGSTAGSIRALNHALELAVALNAQLTVISVVAPLPITVYSSPVGIPSALLESEDVEQTAKLLRKGVAYSKPRLPVHTRLRKGHPAEEIAAQAREGYHDLVIVGSRGRGRLATSPGNSR
jgi:nucleotide-binding universal stress UspA family protein